jgi:hypothetical protein
MRPQYQPEGDWRHTFSQRKLTLRSSGRNLGHAGPPCGVAAQDECRGCTEVGTPYSLCSLKSDLKLEMRQSKWKAAFQERGWEIVP